MSSFSCGDYYDSNSSSSEKFSSHSTGALGQVMTDEKGTADFRLLNRHIRVPDIIGRSFVVQTTDSQYVFFSSLFLSAKINSIYKFRRVACGIIARAAGLFENTKRLCTCSGATVWQERQEAKEHFQ